MNESQITSMMQSSQGLTIRLPLCFWGSHLERNIGKHQVSFSGSVGQGRLTPCCRLSYAVRNLRHRILSSVFALGLLGRWTVMMVCQRQLPRYCRKASKINCCLKMIWVLSTINSSVDSTYHRYTFTSHILVIIVIKFESLQYITRTRFMMEHLLEEHHFKRKWHMKDSYNVNLVTSSSEKLTSPVYDRGVYSKFVHWSFVKFLWKVKGNYRCSFFLFE